MPPLPHHDRRRDRHPGRERGRLAGKPGGIPRGGIPPPPLPSAPPPPPPPLPPPRLACHCCRCRCSRCHVRRRSRTARLLAASWATSACAAPSFSPLHAPHPLHPLHLLQPLTPRHPRTPLHRCVEAAAAQPACSFSVAAPPASLLKMVQACAPRVHGACTAYYTSHPSASRLATCWPSAPPHAAQALTGASHRPRGNARRALRRCECHLCVRCRALAAQLERTPRPRPPCSRARRAVRRARCAQERGAPHAGGGGRGGGGGRKAVAAPYGVGGRSSGGTECAGGS